MPLYLLNKFYTTVTHITRVKELVLCKQCVVSHSIADNIMILLTKEFGDTWIDYELRIKLKCIDCFYMMSNRPSCRLTSKYRRSTD